VPDFVFLAPLHRFDPYSLPYIFLPPKAATLYHLDAPNSGVTNAPLINISMNPTNRTSKQQLRESLTAEIIADLEQEIHDELLWAPESLTEKDRKAIRDDVIAQTQHVTNALTTEELQNEGARRAYTCGALATVRQMINLRMAENRNCGPT